MRILVIDNDLSFGPLVRNVLAAYYHEGPLVVDQVAECPKVVNHLLIGADVAIVDTEMVDREGINCMKAIREAHKHLPVIMLSDTSNVEFAQTCLDAGADDYVMKENVKRLLPDTVKSAIERRNKKLVVESEVERRGQRLESLKERVESNTYPILGERRRHL